MLQLSDQLIAHLPSTPHKLEMQLIRTQVRGPRTTAKPPTLNRRATTLGDDLRAQTAPKSTFPRQYSWKCTESLMSVRLSIQKLVILEHDATVQNSRLYQPESFEDDRFGGCVIAMSKNFEFFIR